MRRSRSPITPTATRSRDPAPTRFSTRSTPAARTTACTSAGSPTELSRIALVAPLGGEERRVRSTRWSSLALLTLLAACSKPQGKRTDAGIETDTGVGIQTDAGADLQTHDAGAIMVAPGRCPSEREPIAGKIYAEAAYLATTDDVWPVAVWLRAASLPAVPDCPGDSAR